MSVDRSFEEQRMSALLARCAEGKNETVGGRHCIDVSVHKTDSRVNDPRGCPEGSRTRSPRNRTLALSPFLNITTAATPARQYDFGNANHCHSLVWHVMFFNSVRFQVSRSWTASPGLRLPDEVTWTKVWKVAPVGVVWGLNALREEVDLLRVESCVKQDNGTVGLSWNLEICLNQWSSVTVLNFNDAHNYLVVDQEKASNLGNLAAISESHLFRSPYAATTNWLITRRRLA